MAGIRTFVAVGDSQDDVSSIGYSTTGGQSWLVSANTNGLFFGSGGQVRGGVAYGYKRDGSGVFVAVGSSADDASNIGFSLNDGQSWSVASETNGLFFGNNGKGRGVAYGYTLDGSGVFVAVGSGNSLSNIGYSLNGGDTWSVVSSVDTNGLFFGSTGNGRGIASDGSGVFVAVGSSADDLSNIGFSSDGGLTWQVSTATDGLFTGADTNDAVGYGVAYGYTPAGSGVFVAVGKSQLDASSIGYSPDGGQTWSVVSPENRNGLFFDQYGTGKGEGIAYGYTPDGGGVFVAVGSGNDASNIGFSLTGGLTWQVANNTDGLFQGGEGIGVTFGYTSDGSGVFVALGNSTNDLSNIGYSFDGGQTWRVASPGNLDGLFFGDQGRAVAFSHTLPPEPPTLPPISNICFPAGTPIKTDQGIFPIEKLHRNKHTINQQPIQHITKTITQYPYLICFDKNALGPNVPSEKTTMTKQHKILFKGRYVAAEKFLSLSKKVTKIKYNGELLYNVLLANYGTLQVNNLVCETLHPDNLIAKLYNNYKEAERPDLVCQLNTSLLERDVKKYKAVERKILHK
jgi:hypothetical protein